MRPAAQGGPECQAVAKSMFSVGDPDGASFRDPAGYVFRQGGLVKRLVTSVGRDAYRRLMASGLYERLVAEGLLVSHVEESSSENGETAAILVPEQISLLSYPYEWSFGQLRDAGLLTLRVQEVALAHGMSLKDASAFNVQFRGPKAVFIDTLSFEVNDGGPWPAYNQFCRHFVAPLALMGRVAPSANQLWRSFLDGFPLDFASSLLPWTSRLRFGLLLHLHLHARSLRRHSRPGSTASDTQPTYRGPDRKKVLVESLRSTLEGLTVWRRKTEWVNYYQDLAHYSGRAEQHKREVIAQWVSRVGPSLVYDLGANTGEYTRLVATHAHECVAFDIDPLCVHANYERAKAEASSNILPLLMDLTNPTPAAGFHLRERLSLLDRPRAGLVMALALIHHLRVTGNAPFAIMAPFLADLGDIAIVEFVPKQDPMAQGLLAGRRDTFIDYDEQGFVAAFRPAFEVLETSRIPDTERTLYLFRRRTGAAA